MTTSRTPPAKRKAFSRYADDVVASPFAGTRSQAAGVLGYLQDQLVATGCLSKPFDTVGMKAEDVTRLERCLNSLLTKQADEQATQVHLMSKFRNLASEYARLETQVGRDKANLVTTKHERETARADAASAKKALNAEVNGHNLAKEEANKARLALQTVKTAAIHENKRRESELAAAHARLNKAASACATHTIMTLNSAEGVNRCEVNTSHHSRMPSPEALLLEQSLSSLECAHLHLQDESLQLREVIGDIESEVRATLVAIGVTGSLASDASEHFVYTPMPHTTLTPNELTERLSRLFIQLRESAIAVNDNARTSVEAAAAKARMAESAKVSELEASLIAMQAELDEARAHAQDLGSSLDQLEVEAATRKAQARVQAKAEDMQAHDLRQKRKELEAERKKVAEAAMQLADERVALDRDRIKYLEEQAVSRAKRANKKAEIPVKQEAKVTAHLLQTSGDRAARQSGGSRTAVRSILAASADTPPAVLPRIVLSPVKDNSQPRKPSLSSINATASKALRQEIKGRPLQPLP